MPIPAIILAVVRRRAVAVVIPFAMKINKIKITKSS